MWHVLKIHGTDIGMVYLRFFIEQIIKKLKQ